MTDNGNESYGKCGLRESKPAITEKVPACLGLIMKNLILPVGFILLVGIGVACVPHMKGSRQDLELSEKPPVVASSFSIGEQTSRLNATISLPHDVIRKAIQSNVPAQFSDNGSHGVDTFPFRSILGPGPAVRVDFNWAILAERGDVSVSTHGESLRIRVPISISGWGGLAGGLGSLVGADRKNIRGAIEAHIDVSFDIDEDWCPRVKAISSFKWTRDAEIEIIGGVWVNVSGKVGNDIQKALDAAAARIPGAINCDSFKLAVTKEWKSRSITVGSVNGSVARLDLTPTRAGFSGITYNDQGVQFAVAFTAKNKLVLGGSQVSDSSSVPLPKLERIPADHGKIEIALPMKLKYGAITNAIMSAIPNDGLSGDSPLGAANIKIHELALYSTRDGKLALGLQLSAKFEKKWFSSRGWLWLTCVPIVDADNQEMALRDPSFTRQLDNQLVSVITSLLREPINNLIAQKVKFDLKPSLAELRSRLAEHLNDPKETPGMRVSLRPDFIGLSEIAPGQDALVIKVRFDASASIEISEIGKMSQIITMSWELTGNGGCS